MKSWNHRILESDITLSDLSASVNYLSDFFVMKCCTKFCIDFLHFYFIRISYKQKLRGLLSRGASFLLFPYGYCFSLPKCHIQNHHDQKSCHHTDGSQIGVLSLIGLRNQFLCHNIDHCPCRKGKKPRHKRCNLYCDQRNSHAENQFNQT